jgi:predicted RNA polymerase sigma factor
MRLNYLLLENPNINEPTVNALMSLMCVHALRFEARSNDLGEPIFYQDQNRDLWSEDLIQKGNYFLIERL